MLTLFYTGSLPDVGRREGEGEAERWCHAVFVYGHVMVCGRGQSYVLYFNFIKGVSTICSW